MKWPWGAEVREVICLNLCERWRVTLSWGKKRRGLGVNFPASLAGVLLSLTLFLSVSFCPALFVCSWQMDNKQKPSSSYAAFLRLHTDTFSVSLWNLLYMPRKNMALNQKLYDTQFHKFSAMFFLKWRFYKKHCFGIRVKVFQTILYLNKRMSKPTKTKWCLGRPSCDGESQDSCDTSCVSWWSEFLCRNSSRARRRAHIDNVCLRVCACMSLCGTPCKRMQSHLHAFHTCSH